jgi:hypothetical protein
MCFVEGDYVIQDLPPASPDPAFGDTVLPWGLRAHWPGRILDDPALFFKAQRQEKTPPAASTELIRDLEMVTAIVNRAHPHHSTCRGSCDQCFPFGQGLNPSIWRKSLYRKNRLSRASSPPLAGLVLKFQTIITFRGNWALS